MVRYVIERKQLCYTTIEAENEDDALQKSWNKDDWIETDSFEYSVHEEGEDL